MRNTLPASCQTDLYGSAYCLHETRQNALTTEAPRQQPQLRSTHSPADVRQLRLQYRGRSGWAQRRTLAAKRPKFVRPASSYVWTSVAHVPLIDENWLARVTTPEMLLTSLRLQSVDEEMITWLAKTENSWGTQSPLIYKFSFQSTGFIMLAASSGERDVTVWRPSVLTYCFCLALIGRADSPGAAHDAASVHFRSRTRTDILVSWCPKLGLRTLTAVSQLTYLPDHWLDPSENFEAPCCTRSHRIAYQNRTLVVVTKSHINFLKPQHTEILWCPGARDEAL